MTGTSTLNVNAEQSQITSVGSLNGLTIAASSDLIITTHDSTNGLKLGGTLVTASAAQLNTYVLNVSLENISTALTKCYVVAPKAGKITNIWCVIDAEVTAANAVITANINGERDIGTITIPVNSLAGAIASLEPLSVNYNNTIRAGQYIRLSRTNAASTGAIKGVFTIEITY